MIDRYKKNDGESFVRKPNDTHQKTGENRRRQDGCEGISIPNENRNCTTMEHIAHTIDIGNSSKTSKYFGARENNWEQIYTG